MPEPLHLSAGRVDVGGEAGVALQASWVQMAVDGGEAALRLHCAASAGYHEVPGVPTCSQAWISVELEVGVLDSEESRGLLSAAHTAEQLRSADVGARVRPLQLLGLFLGSLIVEMLHFYLLFIPNLLRE